MPTQWSQLVILLSGVWGKPIKNFSGANKHRDVEYIERTCAEHIAFDIRA